VPKEIYITATDETCETWSIVLPDYSSGFVISIKSKLPQDMRNWNPEDRCWEVNWEWVDLVESIAVQFFPGAEVVKSE